MSFYDEVGARPFINASGCMYTRYGGSIMPDAVVAAMVEASKRFVNLFELQNQVGRAIAEMTQNEAGFVCCGAASGLLLCAATAMAGCDQEKAERLPGSGGLRNQFIMRGCGLGTEADPVIRAAGGRIISGGPVDRSPEPQELFDAINEQTAAIVLVELESEGLPDAEAIIAGAHERNIPVFIDGACALPPSVNLWRYTRDFGADAFVTSGGKAIRGPQSTGLVLGKSWVVEGCKFHASPNLRIGRGMKVGKEEFAGIYTALKLFLDSDEDAENSRQERLLASIVDHLKGLTGARMKITNDCTLQIVLDPLLVPMSSEQIAAELLNTDPSILLSGRGGRISVRANLLQDGEEAIIADRLRRLIGSVQKP